MASGSDFFLLPATPTELCFDKDEFMKVFSVNSLIFLNIKIKIKYLFSLAF